MLDSYYKSKALLYQLSENLHDYNFTTEILINFCLLRIHNDFKIPKFQYFQVHRPLETYIRSLILS